MSLDKLLDIVSEIGEKVDEVVVERGFELALESLLTVVKATNSEDPRIVQLESDLEVALDNYSTTETEEDEPTKDQLQ